jgi:hypothetical protein
MTSYQVETIDQCSQVKVYILLGTLSKSIGQIIRVSAAMHVLFDLDVADPADPFNDEEDPIDDPHNPVHDASPSGDLSTEIPEKTLAAAIDFVEICCQHAVYIAGHGKIEDELDLLESGTGIYM